MADLVACNVQFVLCYVIIQWSSVILLPQNVFENVQKNGLWDVMIFFKNHVDGQNGPRLVNAA